MPVRCQDCNHHFLLDATTVANGISCPGCGGRQVERDQPSPTHSDGELRDMVDPATQLDQGGNPLQEGVWAGVDGGWQPAIRRDESFASVRLPNSSVMYDHFSRSLPQDPYLPWFHQAEVKRYDNDDRTPITMTTAEWEEHIAAVRKEAFGPLIAPLVAAGGRMLLSRALPMLMGMAVRGAGNHLMNPQQQQIGPEGDGARSVGLVASEHTAVGVNAPVETPGSVPDMVEDHDPESVDQQEFNDGDMSPAFNNPNRDDADGGLSQTNGEDGVKQKIEFRHDGDGVGQAEMLLPLILEYINSDKSALDNPQLKTLHEQLEREIPDYLNLAGENDDDVKELLEAIKKGSKNAAPVYMTTPMNPNQMQMGQGQQMAMPGTHQNPVQPSGMPVSGKCVNCGSVTNADGSCPQCGAAAGANQQGNLDAINQPHLNTPGIMPSPYAQRSAGVIEHLKCADCGEEFTADSDHAPAEGSLRRVPDSAGTQRRSRGHDG
jgi:DNA-directed RNA polymerase subunit RPC12/RpoP/rubrerythrin